MTTTEATEPAEDANGIEIPIQPYIDSLKRQLAEQSMKSADEIAQRDALIETLRKKLSEASEFIDNIGEKTNAG